MKIHLRTASIPSALHGWKRVVRRVKNVFQGTLVVETGRLTFELVR